MPSTRDLRRRIKSIKNTSQITKAMQMVAASKMRKAQQAALAGRPYAARLNAVMSEATAAAGDYAHPLMEMREVKNRGLIVVSTDKKGPYDLERKGANTLILKLSKASIPPQLLREVDPSQFSGVVERIRPAYSPSENQVSLAIVLKEMVPFHVDQKDKGVTIEFGPTSELFMKPQKKETEDYITGRFG